MLYATVNRSDLSETFRLDAEHYSPRFHTLLASLSAKPHKYLLDVIKCPVMTGHTPSKAVDSFYQDGSIKFIKTDNLRDGYLVLGDVELISEEGNKEIARSELQANDVIVTIIGATEKIVGRACMIFEDIGRANINQNIALIRPTIPAGFITTYFNSNYGKSQLYWLSRQTEQVNLNCREVEKVRVPIFSPDFYLLVDKVYRGRHTLLNVSKSVFYEAQQLLLEDLGLAKWKAQHQLSYTKSFSDTQKADRFDAEFFQPKYDAVLEKVFAYSNGALSLFPEAAELRDNNFSPDGAKKYKYIELSNISANGEITGYTEDMGINLPTRARRIVATGDIIVSSVEGSLDSIAMIDKQSDGALCSTGFYVLRGKTINAETLLVFLKSTAGQLQLKKGCSGTILTAISKEEISRVVIPHFDEDVQSKIKSLVQEMYATRETSKALLEIAKRGVEIAIEQDETKAESWIKAELGKINVSLDQQ